MRVVRHVRDGMLALECAGEIDIASSEELERTFAEAMEHPSALVVLDLRQVDFMDSNGIRLVARAHRALADHGRRLVIVAADGPVRRLLGLTRIDSHIDVVGDPSDIA